MVILDATSAPPGRLPEGWQLKVNRGSPRHHAHRGAGRAGPSLQESQVVIRSRARRGCGHYTVSPAHLDLESQRVAGRVAISAAIPPTTRPRRSSSPSPTTGSSATSGTPPRQRAPGKPTRRFLLSASLPWCADPAPGIEPMGPRIAQSDRGLPKGVRTPSRPSEGHPPADQLPAHGLLRRKLLWGYLISQRAAVE